MLKIIGWDEGRDITPIRGEDGNFVELVPGRTRGYLRLQVLGKTLRLRLRLPFWALGILSLGGVLALELAC